MKFAHIELGMEVEPKGKSPSHFVQVHGTNIITLPGSPGPLLKADGAITHEKNKEIYIFSADCMPVLFFGEDTSDPIAAVHSGWRGTRDGILSEAAKKLSQVKKLHVWIGPHIKSCCFKVKKDFLNSFKSMGIDPLPFLKEGRFDLLDYVFAKELKDIPQENRHLESALCTVCSNPKLPSFRREKTTDPRIRSWIKKV